MTALEKAGNNLPIEKPFGFDLDAIIRDVYRAGAGLADWITPLKKMEDTLSAWLVQFLCVDKRTGTLSFSYEAGKASPECALDYFRHYSRIDPRAALLAKLPAGNWVACEEHFDETYVAASPFYQEFLLPYGGRYVFAAKIFEDADRALTFSMIRGRDQPPFDVMERRTIQRLASHVLDAFDMNMHLSRKSEQLNVGQAVLARMRQPIILIDDVRRIMYANSAGQAIIDRGELFLNANGLLSCADTESDIDMMLAMREIALAPHNASHIAVSPRLERRIIRMVKKGSRQPAMANMLALRPETTLGTFGFSPQVLVTIYEPDTASCIELDPLLLATLFDFTPAEARVAAAMANGSSPKEIATTFGVALSTIRSQLLAIFAKTGATRQSELVHILLRVGEL